MSAAPIKSLTMLYSFSAPSEFVWKNENGDILKFNPKRFSVIKSSPYRMFTFSGITASDKASLSVCIIDFNFPFKFNAFISSVHSVKSKSI